MTTLAAAPPRARLGPGRVAAVLAVGSASVHLVLAGSGALSALLMAGMALACLPCGWHLWRSASASVWALTAAVDVGMLAVHAPMVLGGGSHPDMQMTGMQMTGMGTAGPSAWAWAGLVLVTAQLALAGGVLVRR